MRCPDGRTEREGVVLFLLVAEKAERVPNLAVEVRAVVTHHVALVEERRLDPEVGQSDLDGPELRVLGHVLVPKAGVLVDRALALRVRVVLVVVADGDVDRRGQPVEVLGGEGVSDGDGRVQLGGLELVARLSVLSPVSLLL